MTEKIAKNVGLLQLLAHQMQVKVLLKFACWPKGGNYKS